MWSLLKESDYDLKGASSRLWMTEKQVKDLSDKGHSIGLHSYNHPTVMSNLPLPDQRKEYHANKEHLEGVIGKQIDCMSHPCGNYSPQTLDLLTEMGVQIGFRSSLSEVKIKSNLEIPRQDDILAFKEMRK
jgi:peptidoglycan/xylan/chitin deacetylase (PgdA/CDA1 family)